MKFISEEAREEFRKYLKRNKHRITPERFEVLDYAIGNTGHFAADELFVAMKTDGSNVSRATVYNTLELLAKCGLISKRNFGENKSFYESSFNIKNHDHIICVNCGKIIEFSSGKIAKLAQEISEKNGMDFVGYSFNIYGRCKDTDKCKIE